MENRLVTCKECKEKLRKNDAIYEKPSYYHRTCYESKCQRREFFDYVCRLFHIKAPGPAILTQRKRFVQDYGYTDNGMLKTLKYMYEVKRLNVQRADERIGLLPNYYDEAQTYFEELQQRQNINATMMAKQMKENESNIIFIKKEEVNSQRKPQLINPMDWWEDE